MSPRNFADFEIIELSSFVLPKRAGPVARMERRDIRGGGPAFRRCAPPCGLRMFAEIIGFFSFGFVLPNRLPGGRLGSTTDLVLRHCERPAFARFASYGRV